MSEAKQLSIPGVSLKPKVAPPRPAKDAYPVFLKIAWTLCKRLSEEDSEVTTPPSLEELPSKEDFESDTWEKPDNFFGDLLEVVSDNTHDLDGFHIGRLLERDHGWEMNAQKISLLDDAYFLQTQFHDTLVKDWVTTYELIPKYALGNVVRIGRPRFREAYTGTIVKVDTLRLSYVVQIDSLGHGIRDIHGNVTYGFVVNEEDILGVGFETSVPKV